MEETAGAAQYGFLLLFSTILSLVLASTACSNGSCQLHDACLAVTDCASGLYCGNCPAAGMSQPSCTRGMAIMPTAIVKGLPFNKYSWLVTHNSFSIVNAPLVNGVPRVTFLNQEDSVSNQLRNGVRGFMLDMYDFDGDIWLCHSTQGRCFNFTAFAPAIDTLKEIEAFLSENPSEIVTIIIEDYVHTPKGLTNLFANAGLLKYWFPVSQMPKNGDWPTVTEMVSKNQRLLVFTSMASKEADEGIAYQWRYMVENEPGDPGVSPGSCPSRKESQPLQSKHPSLFLMNYFHTFPTESEACKENSDGLVDMLGTCFKASGNRMPNYLAVNFYMRSTGTGAFGAVDKMNGQTLCGCATVIGCQSGAPPGICNEASTTSPAVTDGGRTIAGTVQFVASASTIQIFDLLLFYAFYLLFMAFHLL